MTSSRCGALRFALAASVVLAVLAAPVSGGESSDTQGWLEYQYRHQINDRFRTNWRLGYRDLLSSHQAFDWSRFHLATHLGYQYSPLVAFEAGLGSYYSLRDPLGDVFELRAWQGMVIRWPEVRLPRRHFPFHHRLRFEQRWIGVGSSGGTDFSTRVRYRLAVAIPLNGPEIEERVLYLPLATELFTDLGNDSAELFAARARVTTGLGYVVNTNWAVEFRYTAQRARDTVIEEFQTTDHIFDLRIRTTLRLRDLSMPW